MRPYPGAMAFALAFALAFAFAFAGAGCIDTRSGDFTCDTTDDCDDGRMCADGWCIDPDVVIDADPADAPGGGDALVADADTTDAPPAMCGDGVCSAGETPAGCNQDCGICDDMCQGGTCSQVCGDGADCDYACPTTDCTCNYDCRRANTCAVECAAGSTCDIDCQMATDCGQVVCSGGAECLLRCTGAGTCDFAECSGGAGMMSCSGNRIVCNRPCPG